MHAVPHDHHPGDAGDTSVLHLLVWVAVPSVGVSVAVGVSVMLHLLLVLLGGNIQWQLVCRRLGCLDSRQLCVVVTIVAGGVAGFWVWRRAKRVMWYRETKWRNDHFCYFYLHQEAWGAATLHLSDDLTCGRIIFCQSYPPHSPSSWSKSKKIPSLATDIRSLSVPANQTGYFQGLTLWSL